MYNVAQKVRKLTNEGILVEMRLESGRIGQLEQLGSLVLAAVRAHSSGDSQPPLLQAKVLLPGDGEFHRAIAQQGGWQLGGVE